MARSSRTSTKQGTLLHVPRQSSYRGALHCGYIAMELHVLHSNHAKFNGINVLKLFCLSLHFLELINSSLLVCRPLGSKISQDLYPNL